MTELEFHLIPLKADLMELMQRVEQRQRETEEEIDHLARKLQFVLDQKSRERKAE